MQNQIDTLLKLEEEIHKARENFFVHQYRMKRWFYKKSLVSNEFHVGDLVLKWDKSYEYKDKHTKFQDLWIKPFWVKERPSQHPYNLKTLEWWIQPLPVNGEGLKFYFT